MAESGQSARRRTVGVQCARCCGSRSERPGGSSPEGNGVSLLEYCLEHGYELRFIEQMPLDAHHAWTRGEMVTAEDVLARLTAGHTLFQLRDLASQPGQFEPLIGTERGRTVGPLPTLGRHPVAQRLVVDPQLARHITPGVGLRSGRSRHGCPSPVRPP